LSFTATNGERVYLPDDQVLDIHAAEHLGQLRVDEGHQTVGEERIEAGLLPFIDAYQAAERAGA
jgi:hypothetical protein